MGKGNITGKYQLGIDDRNRPTRIINKNTTILTSPDLVASDFGVASSSRDTDTKKSFITASCSSRPNYGSASTETSHRCD